MSLEATTTNLPPFLNLHAGNMFALREVYFKEYGSSPRQNMHKNNSKIKH